MLVVNTYISTCINYGARGMVENEWLTIRIPILMAQAIDKWLTLDIAKKNGVISRTDFATRVIGQWFAEFEQDFGIFVPREMRRNLKGFDVMKPLDS
jgi:hypothetical protein